MDKIERLSYNRQIERLRKSEYPMLKGITYLDHGGTTLTSKSFIESFCKEMQTTLLSNPHSDASNPSTSALIIRETREKVLWLFGADPEHFDVVFTANATGAIKLVMEGFSGHNQGFDYYYHRNCHTSLVGVREHAQQSYCLASDEEAEKWRAGHLLRQQHQITRPKLFAYPAQSNMNGERLPLDWPSQIRNSTLHPDTYTLLDAAAYVSTTPLDLSRPETAPDFIALSFYKIFGFPDLGALIVRKASAHMLDHKKYFGGGTTEMITCIGEPWVARKESSIHVRLEDGTVAIRSILALRCAISSHQKLFGGLKETSTHTAWLAKDLYDRLVTLRHANGRQVCHIYKAQSSTYGDSKSQGPTVVFNVQKADGTWRGSAEVGSALRSNKIHVRTGSLCNPAGMACALNLSAADVRHAYDSGFRCNQGYDVWDGVPFGMVRITLGAMSTLRDIQTLIRFFQHRFMSQQRATTNPWLRACSLSSTKDGLCKNGVVKEHTKVTGACQEKRALNRPKRLKSVYRVIWSRFSRDSLVPVIGTVPP